MVSQLARPIDETRRLVLQINKRVSELNILSVTCNQLSSYADVLMLAIAYNIHRSCSVTNIYLYVMRRCEA